MTSLSRPAACGFCGGALRYALSAPDRNRAISRTVFHYRRCEHCGAYSLENVPSDLGRYYPDDYYALPRDRAQADLSLSGDQYKLDIIRRHVQSGRLLEIGPGAGMFAYLASKSGFAVEVIEMAEKSARFIRDVLGIRTHHVQREVDAIGACGKFDVIALWHVIEHLEDPVALMRAAAQALQPGGILALATPNPQSLQFRLLRGRWAHLDAPRHLHLIPAGALRDAGARLGLAEAEYTTSDEGTLYWNRFGWEHSLRAMAPGPLGARIARRIARAASWLLGPLERRDGLGSAYTMILRRP